MPDNSAPPAFPTPLHIAIVGAGRIGSTFAFQLALAGRNDVTVIARPGSARLAQLRRDGAIVNVEGERAGVRVLDTLDEETPYDLVIVTLLAHQLGSVLPSLQRSAAGCVQFMFNTFDPDRLLQAVGVDRCSFGMPFVQATLDDDGRFRAVIGAAGQKTIMGRRRWMDLFDAAGIPAMLEPNMPVWLRCHAPLCAAFESVAVAGARRGGGASWREALTLARGVHACFALIEQLGGSVYPRAKRVMYRSPAAGVAAMLWAMSRIPSFRELLATGAIECSALVDAMDEAAVSAHQPHLAAKIRSMKPA